MDSFQNASFSVKRNHYNGMIKPAAVVKMEIAGSHAQSLKSRILCSSSFHLDKTFLGVMSVTFDQLW